MSLIIDPDARLAEVRRRAKEYLDLAGQAQDRAERDFCERIVGLYLKISGELEIISDRQKTSAGTNNSATA
jgi:hypothetical protein